MNIKINQIKNNNYNNKLIKIINEYFIEYNKQIEDQYQKKLISEIFDHMNNILRNNMDMYDFLQRIMYNFFCQCNSQPRSNDDQIHRHIVDKSSNVYS